MGIWKKIKRRFCKHMYADITLQVCDAGEAYLFTNRCVKCGKSYTVDIKKEVMYSIIEEDMRRLRLYGKLY